MIRFNNSIERIEWIRNASPAQLRAVLAIWVALDAETFDEGVAAAEIIAQIGE